MVMMVPRFKKCPPPLFFHHAQDHLHIMCISFRPPTARLDDYWREKQSSRTPRYSSLGPSSTLWGTPAPQHREAGARPAAVPNVNYLGVAFGRSSRGGGPSSPRSSQPFARRMPGAERMARLNGESSFFFSPLLLANTGNTQASLVGREKAA